ncbi:L-fucono-1,5-lactonase-like isoform X2 [Sycon ciliatum]|uniref:L-fucono-1,5-lactonase-like isoform X2 n=1 Tax=Sycon ciliatum TaxID=27933 RepID=UPI0031F71E9F
MSYVDSHHHFWDLEKFQYDGFPPKDTVLRQTYLFPDLKAAIADTPVKHTVFVQVFHGYEENAWILKLVEDVPTVAGVVAWVDLTDPKVGDLIDNLKTHSKFCGIRHIIHDEADHNWILREDVRRGLGVLEEKGVTFDLLLRPPNLPAIPAIAKEFPKLKFVIDHIAKPLIKDGVVQPWKDDITKCAVFPNVYVKLSGFVTEANHASWTMSDLQDYATYIIGTAHLPYLWTAIPANWISM